MDPARDRLDWRWRHVTYTADMTIEQVENWLDDCDDTVLALYRFKLRSDSGMGPDLDRPDVYRAYQLWSDQDRAWTRCQVECLLLADETDDAISRVTRVPPSVVRAYHDGWFDCRSAITDGQTMWISAQLFPRGAYTAIDSRDHLGAMHRMAWLYGPGVARAYLDGFWRNSGQLLPQDVVRVAHDQLLKRTPLILMSLSGRSDSELALIAGNLKETATKLEEAKASTKQDTGQLLMDFLSRFTIDVADPTDQRNLTLPADEPRDHEMIAEAMKELACQSP